MASLRPNHPCANEQVWVPFSTSLAEMIKRRILGRPWGLALPLSVAVAISGFNAAAHDVNGDRLVVRGDQLIFDTDAVSDPVAGTSHLTEEDARSIGELLMDHPEIRTVVLSGAGGSSYAAEGIARKIIEFDLDTVAVNRCSSACATVFLAGANRKLAKGGRLCFHRFITTAAEYRDIYTSMKDYNDWQDEFEFAEAVSEAGQIKTRDFIQFAVSRGVSVDFALKTFDYSANDIWCPSREELASSGVMGGGE